MAGLAAGRRGILTGMDAPEPKRRRYYPTPAWPIFGLLVAKGLLWLSERYRWFWINEAEKRETSNILHD